MLRSSLAFCEQTRTQLPQAMQRSPITFGLALGDADRLDGALPHARVAHAAALVDGRDVGLVMATRNVLQVPSVQRMTSSRAAFY